MGCFYERKTRVLFWLRCFYLAHSFASASATKEGQPCSLKELDYIYKTENMMNVLNLQTAFKGKPTLIGALTYKALLQAKLSKRSGHIIILKYNSLRSKTLITLRAFIPCKTSRARQYPALKACGLMLQTKRYKIDNDFYNIRETLFLNIAGITVRVGGEVCFLTFASSGERRLGTRAPYI